jgi:hypothetical protein
MTVRTRGENVMRRRKIYILSAFLAALVLTACASTRVTSDWSDPSYGKQPAKVLVLSSAKQTADLRLIEEEFAAELKSSGVDAVPGYTVLPEGKRIDREAVEAKARELGADAVLVAKLVDKKTERDYVPGTAYGPPAGYYGYSGYYPGAYGGFYGAYPGGYSPGYVTERVYGIAEATLYDMATGKPVWAATTETEMRGNNSKEITSYVEQVVNAMKKKELIPSG